MLDPSIYAEGLNVCVCVSLPTQQSVDVLVHTPIRCVRGHDPTKDATKLMLAHKLYQVLQIGEVVPPTVYTHTHTSHRYIHTTSTGPQIDGWMVN